MGLIAAPHTQLLSLHYSILTPKQLKLYLQPPGGIQSCSSTVSSPSVTKCKENGAEC